MSTFPSSTSSSPASRADAGVTRRSVLRGGGAAVAAALAPRIHVRRRPRLRVLGTHVTLQEPLRVRAEADLDIDIEFAPGGSAEVLQQASTRPGSFDVYEQWSNSVEILWQAGAIRPIERSRIARFDEVNGLCKVGRVVPGAPLGAGAAPVGLLGVQPDGSLGADPSGQLSFLPYVHNVDAFGYNAAICGRGEPYVTESWSWLLDERWSGRVGVVNEPAIGLFDLALACRAKGLVTFADIGNITRAEMDELFDVVLRLRRDGHFHGFWTSVPHSIDLMSSGRVVIESMFSPAATVLRGQGLDVVYAAPREGYRAWHGVMCLSSQATEEATEAAYAYMNWWLSGWPGAFVARQGYYISTHDRCREHLSDAEWRYWYGGEPARQPLRGSDGTVCVAPGEVRRGGDYAQRLGNIAVWNTVMDTYEYSLSRWYSLLTS